MTFAIDPRQPSLGLGLRLGLGSGCWPKIWRGGASETFAPDPNTSWAVFGQVKNSSRIPIIFAIDPPQASSGVFRVSPIAGLLLGNQTSTVSVIFAPRETKEYRFRLPVKVGATVHIVFFSADFFFTADTVGTVGTVGTVETIV